MQGVWLRTMLVVALGAAAFAPAAFLNWRSVYRSAPESSGKVSEDRLPRENAGMGVFLDQAPPSPPDAGLIIFRSKLIGAGQVGIRK